MRKSKMVLLAAAVAVGLAAPAMSAEHAGIGLNWGIGPMIRDICINRLMFRQKKDLLDA